MIWLADFFTGTWEFFMDMLSDGPWGIATAVLLAATIIFVVGLAVCGLYWMADHAYRDVELGVGAVMQHHYDSPHTTMVMVGKVMVPQHHEATYSLCISVGPGSGWISVTKAGYDEFGDGDLVNVKYDVGRLSGDVNVRDIMPRVSSFGRQGSL